VPRKPRDALEDGQVELGADDRRVRQHAVAKLGQPREPLSHQFAHAFGEPCTEVEVGEIGRPPAVAVVQAACFYEVADYFFDEERIALSRTVEVAGEDV